MNRQFEHTWILDFEFHAPSGTLPVPLCLSAVEINSNRRLQLFGDELTRLHEAPFDTGPASLFVAYYAAAELSCFLSLNWRLPDHVVDLYAEFRRLTNGLCLPLGHGLLAALSWFNLDALSATAKTAYRELAIRGGPFTAEERTTLLRYCDSDVDATRRLFTVMADKLTPHSLLRGRYTKAVAHMERNGIPIDAPLFKDLTDRWTDIAPAIVGRADLPYQVYEGVTFKHDRFLSYLDKHGIVWPRLDTGALALDSDTFRDRAKLYPELQQLRELRATLSQLRLFKLAVGPDARNRCLLSPFRSITGRNQPSNRDFVFGPATWIRGLIRPEPGTALAYIDWNQQEFGIAAALSADQAMQRAYTSGDPYLGFAKTVGAVPQDATKQSHPTERDKFKTTVLGVQYCMSAHGLANRLNVHKQEAQRMLDLHHKAFPTFWEWSDAAVAFAMLHCRLHSVFDWQINVVAETNPRTLRNFPMQANAAEMLRLACCLATERGIKVDAPIHDALLVEGPATEINDVVEAARDCMRQASAAVLGGFELTADAKVITYPSRFMDPRGESMWSIVMDVLKGGAL